jgi:hypothetical protein
MKIRIYLLVLPLMSCFFSCSKSIEISSPEFNVTVAKQTYNVNEAVEFKFSGSADYVTFYDGSDGHNYEFRERTSIEGAVPQLKFDSEGKFGTQVNTLALLVSRNFNGQLNKESIYDAKWIDITDRATLSAGTVVSSGTIDLSDFIQRGPIHIAFKYIGKNMATPQKTWYITNFSLNTLAPGGKVLPIVPDLASGGWLEHSVAGDARKWRITAANLYIGANANEPDNEDWVITKPLQLTSVNPDAGLAIKDLSGPVSQYAHTYKEAGVYKVVFVAVNGNVYDRKQVVKEVMVTIK